MALKIQITPDGIIKRDIADPTKVMVTVPCGLDSVITADYTVSASFAPDYSTTTIKCCNGVLVQMEATATGEPVGFQSGSGLPPCDLRDGIKGGEGSGAPILTDCGDNLCYCASIGAEETWTYGSMQCGMIGDPTSVCAGPHGSECCCPQLPDPPHCANFKPCVSDPIDILNATIDGEPTVHLIDFINPKAFLNIFHDLETGNYVVIPTGYVMDRFGTAGSYCYSPTEDRPQPLLMAMCCLDYCRSGYDPIVLGQTLAGHSFDISVTLDVDGLIMSPDCWGGAIDGFCLTGFCGCCGLSGTIDFTWHVDFH